MKVFAIAAALFAAVASAEDCNVTTLAPILEETYVAQCSTDTGFSFVPPTVPSAEVLAKVCTSDACKQTLAKLESFGLGDCLLLGTLKLETDLINPINAECGFSSGSSTGSGSVGGGDEIIAPTDSTTAPTGASSDPASSKPAEAEGSASTAASGAEATPAPTPDNGAAQQTAAIAAAVVTVAVAAAL